MIIYFIRHGATAGNLEKRYIGRTDEGLCTEGIESLKRLQELVPDIKDNSITAVCQGVEAVFTSPMKRCIETADILFPDKKKIIIDDFRECDFGDFEGYNYQELNGNADYQRWIDSDGQIAFPNGESPQDFRRRCINGFINVAETSLETVAAVVHGGTIMSILEKYEKHHEYYRWQCGNGSGYAAVYKDGVLDVTDRIGFWL
ncbi:MAG: histidine phosphatase family protein [[Bacteroides] pectinophilus]|nr:histidine phosphatase family protein [[Bacteroides] pectinophilus]